METPNRPTRWLRWLVLGAVVANVIVNYTSQHAREGRETVGEVSDKHLTSFTPAGYAFSIWGLIYLAQIVYSVYQLLPAQKTNAVHDRLAGPLVVASLLSIGWIQVFTADVLWASELLIIGMLATALVAFVRAKEYALNPGNRGRWIVFAFSIYAAWLTVAVIANTAAWLKAEGYDSLGLSAETWAVVLIIVAAGLGIVMSRRFRDLTYPAVVAWALTAIYVANRNESAAVANTALAAAIAQTLWLAGFAAWEQKHPPRHMGTLEVQGSHLM